MTITGCIIFKILYVTFIIFHVIFIAHALVNQIALTSTYLTLTGFNDADNGCAGSR